MLKSSEYSDIPCSRLRQKQWRSGIVKFLRRFRPTHSPLCSSLNDGESS